MDLEGPHPCLFRSFFVPDTQALRKVCETGREWVGCLLVSAKPIILVYRLIIGVISLEFLFPMASIFPFVPY